MDKFPEELFSTCLLSVMEKLNANSTDMMNDANARKICEIRLIRNIRVKRFPSKIPTILKPFIKQGVTITKYCRKIHTMITIRPIKQEEIPEAKHVILSVAYNIFGFEGTLEESIRHFEASGEFNDMDNVQSNYFEAGGTFLVVVNGEQVIGSGALRRLDENAAELKRMWLLEKYHGRGIGYLLISQLIDYATQIRYARIRLQTSPEQTRALTFYRKIGFYEIPCYNDDVSEISMEMKLSSFT